MQFKIERGLEDQVYKTAVKFDQYEGNEAELIADFGAPVLDTGKIIFEGAFIVDPTTKKVVADPAGDAVSFVMNSIKMEVKEDFTLEYSVNSKRVPVTEYENNAVINSAQLYAEAKCVLFENKVKDALGVLLADFKANETNFDKDPAEIFTV